MPAGKFRSALTALAGLTVTGVNANYDINAAPDKIPVASLPVLIVRPAAEEPYRGRFGPFEIETPSGSAALARYVVTHVLLFAAYGRGDSTKDYNPGLVDLVDNYANAIRANPKLGGSLFLPTVYVVYVAPIGYGGTMYYGARFWHTWTLET
jgi:hypothetical protein